MSRDPHPAEAGGVPRPRRRARVAGPWYHSPKAALSGLAVLIAWGLLLPGATPVGGGMSTLGSLSLFGYALFSIVGGIVFLSNRNLGRVLSSCAAVGLLLLWGCSSSVIPARTGRGWPTCSSISRSSAKAG